MLYAKQESHCALGLKCLRRTFGHEAGRCDRSCGGVSFAPPIPGKRPECDAWAVWQVNNRSMDAWPSLEAVWWDARPPNIWPDTVSKVSIVEMMDKIAAGEALRSFHADGKTTRRWA